MTTYIIIFFLALGVAMASTPLARRLALATGYVDQPSARKVHTSPIPLLGGIAIYLASVLAVLLVNNGDQLPGHIQQLAGILVGGTVVALFGLWDDRRSLKPVVKLVGELLAVSILMASGISVEFLKNDVLNTLVTILWVVGITNAVNFLDNMDGLSGGVVAIAAAFFFLLATTNGQVLVASLSAALLGACLGFLRYNFNQASIFMGDTGSLFLGFVLSAVGIKLRFENVDVVTWMIPVMVLGLPIFDTTLVVLSRLRRGVNPFTTAGTDHTSHRLVAMGMTRREAVLTLYLMAMAFGMASLFLLKATIIEGYFTGAVVALLSLAAMIRLEFLSPAGHALSGERPSTQRTLL